MRRSEILIAAGALIFLLVATQWDITKIPAVIGIGIWTVVIFTYVCVDQCLGYLGPWAQQIEVKPGDARKLICRGATILIIAAGWVLACAGLYHDNSQMLQYWGDSRLVIVGLPAILATLVGYSLVFGGIFLQRISSRS